MDESQRVAVAGQVPRADAVMRTLSRTVFRDVDLRGRRVLDIGGGNGLHSFWAVAEGGAAEAVVLDPFVDGSNPAMLAQFERMHAALDEPARVRLCREVLEEHDGGGYDVVIMHNSVNHIHERDTETLQRSEPARERFTAYFRRLAAMMSPGGVLVLSDSSRRNLFGDLRLRNPFAPQLEWHIHQPPARWETLLRAAGLRIVRRSWTSGASRGPVLRPLLSTRFGSYVTTSHFTIVARRER